MSVDSLTIRQKAENVVIAFERGKPDDITVYFDDAVKKGVSSKGGMKMIWLHFNMTCGKFEKADMDNLKEYNRDKYVFIEVPFFFEKEKRILRLVFNADGEISGLTFQPVN